MRQGADRTSRRTVRSVVAVLTAAVGVLAAGCQVVGGGATDQAAVVDTTPLAELDLLENPREHVGESHAQVAETAVTPVTEAPSPQLPVTVTDMQGTEVTVTDVSRILALDLYGTTSRIVFELGLGDNVVGRDLSSSFPEIADAPLVTASGHDLSGEAILELAPTIIITDTTLGPWDVVLQMRDAGIPVVVVDSHRSLDNVGSMIRAVAAALGVPEQGDVLAERTQAEIDATVAEIAEIAPQDPEDKLRVVFLYVRGQAGVYYMFGKGSGTDSLIESLGAVDVATEIGWDGMRPLNDEGLVSTQPDLILMMDKGLESVDGVDGLLEQLPAVAQTPAGQNRRIVTMADNQILSYGPSTPRTLEALARAFYAPGGAS